MNLQQLEDLLRYRIEQAHEALREAEILLNESAFRGTINRAYYAMFYALLALHAAWERRQTHDYGELTVATSELAEGTLAAARTFVDAIQTHLINLEHLSAD